MAGGRHCRLSRLHPPSNVHLRRLRTPDRGRRKLAARTKNARPQRRQPPGGLWQRSGSRPGGPAGQGEIMTTPQPQPQSRVTIPSRPTARSVGFSWGPSATSRPCCSKACIFAACRRRRDEVPAARRRARHPTPPACLPSTNATAAAPEDLGTQYCGDCLRLPALPRWRQEVLSRLLRGCCGDGTARPTALNTNITG